MPRSSTGGWRPTARVHVIPHVNSNLEIPSVRCGFTISSVSSSLSAHKHLLTRNYARRTAWEGRACACGARCYNAGSSLQLIHRRCRATRRCVRRANCALARRGGAVKELLLSLRELLARGEILNATLCQPHSSHRHYQLPLDNHHT